MGQYTKQIAIYIGLLLICSTYTLIAPFYPQVARDKGLPLWLIGIIFSLNPLGNILTTPFLGKYLNRIGRKQVILASYILTALSMFVMSPIEYTSGPYVIVLSVISRLIGGMGASCLFTSIITVFISDYPDQMQTMIGRMEGSIGVGLMIGPLLGSALYFINLFAALAGVAFFILLFSPVAWKMLGKFRSYNIKEINIKRLDLLIQPKIFLCVIMNFAFLFSFGFLAAILEIHLETYGFTTLYISFCFMGQAFFYLVFCLSGGYVLGDIDCRLIMILGGLFLAMGCVQGSPIGYVMLAPFTLIFPNEYYIVILSLPFFSLGQAMTYMFSIPYMIRSAVCDYGYTEDDILTDVISSFAVFGGAVGEIAGPIFAGTLTDFLGIENCCLIVAGLTLGFDIVFIFGTGYARDLVFKRKYNISKSVSSRYVGSVHDPKPENSSILEECDRKLIDK